MKIGVVGLGKMGMAIVERLLNEGHEVFAFDIDQKARDAAQKLGAQTVETVDQLPQHANVIWLMVPAGDTVDQVIEALLPNMQKGHIIVDGGNSKFTNTIRRAGYVAQHGIHLLDCGTSGGLKGREIGFSLMIGGEQKIFESIKPLFAAIAHKNGFGYMGPSGAGHYVKMIHNGIEYALLQSYGEGFDLLKHGQYADLDLEKIARVWNNGGVIRSYILELIQNIFATGQEFDTISGEVAESGTGLWTVEEAHKQKVPVQLIEDALEIRKQSRQTGGNFGTKLVAMLRNAFGGHPVKKK